MYGTFGHGGADRTADGQLHGSIPPYGPVNAAGQGKVMMQFFSPPHMKMERYFSGADATGRSALATSQWIHVAHAVKNGESRLYPYPSPQGLFGHSLHQHGPSGPAPDQGRRGVSRTCCGANSPTT